MGSLLRGVAVLGTSVLCPAWPIMKLITLASHRALPIRHLVPATARRTLQPYSGPLLALLIAAQLFRLALPDQWRTLRLWRRMLPIFGQYMITKYSCDLRPHLNREVVERRWAARHEQGGRQVYRMISDLSGYYVKTGQILASKREIIPEPWCRELSKLWDDTKPRPWRNVRQSIRRGLSQNPQGLREEQQGSRHRSGDIVSWYFERIDEVPLASASVAQVHSARLSPQLMEELGLRWRHGPEVVLKVQHHDVRALMGSDLRNMERVARFLQHLLPFDVLPSVAEMRIVVPREFDFQLEARLMDTVRVRLADAGVHDVVVPEPVPGLCAPGVIVQQRMTGTPYTVLLRTAQSDPGLMKKAQAGLLQLLHAYGHMMLIDGLFHADPHPGNFFLQEDGKVALLDFGQCKALTASEQLALCRLFTAMHDGDGLAALVAAQHFGLQFNSTDVSSTPVGGGPALSSTGSTGGDGDRDGINFGNGDGRRTGLCHNSEVTHAVDTGSNHDSSSDADNSHSNIVSSSGNRGSNSGGTGSIGGNSTSSRSGQGTRGALDMKAALQMLLIMFDTRYIEEAAAYRFSGGAVVEGIAITALPGALYQLCRTVLIMRGLCHGLGLDVSVATLWQDLAKKGLAKPEQAKLREKENFELHGCDMLERL